MPTITIYEHQSIFVGDTWTVALRPDGEVITFKQRHYEALAERLGKKDEQAFPYYSLAKDHHRDGIRFKQYVGVIQAKDLTIEILPKTDQGDENYWKAILLSMLCQVFKLSIRSINHSSQSLKRSSILDLFILRFLDEAERLIRSGLTKTYRKEDDNLDSLKGKLLLSKHLSKNIIHKEKFFVRHSVYDRGHIMNRILCNTLICISESTTNSYLRKRAVDYLEIFPELSAVTVSEDLFSRLVYDRKTDDYREAMTLARLILLNNMPNLSSGKYETLALLFDMNRLWEEFVYVTLRKYLPEYSIKDQVKKDFWESPLRAIKPDIVIRNGADLYILDTKWKKMDKAYPADGDLHQMYVYYKYFDAKGVALVYPSPDQIKGEIRPGFFTDDTVGISKKAACDLMFLPVPDTPDDIRQWQHSIVSIVQEWLIRI